MRKKNNTTSRRSAVGLTITPYHHRAITRNAFVCGSPYRVQCAIAQIEFLKKAQLSENSIPRRLFVQQ